AVIQEPSTSSNPWALAARAAGSGQLAALLVHADAHVVDRRAGAVVDDKLAITTEVYDDESRVLGAQIVVGQTHQLRTVFIEKSADGPKDLWLIEKIFWRRNLVAILMTRLVHFFDIARTIF